MSLRPQLREPRASGSPGGSEVLSSGRQRACLGILLLINMLNYADRTTISGITTFLETADTSGLGKPLSLQQIGLINTSFIVSFVIFSPVFGFLCDRYHRPKLVFIGILLWSGFNIASSFSRTYEQLLFLRAALGVGEAAYATIAPTLITDIFPPLQSDIALGIFYLGIPIGGALGVIGGTAVGAAYGWRWAFRFTAPVGALLALLALTQIPERPRGAMAVVSHAAENGARPAPKRTPNGEPVHTGPLGVLQDLRIICSNPSFLYATLAFTTVTYWVGAAIFWSVQFIPVIAREPREWVSDVLGLVTIVTGIVGTLAGPVLSRHLHPRHPASDAVVCAIGLTVSAPLLLVSTWLYSTSFSAAVLLSFLGQLALGLTWALSMVIMLAVVDPYRRGLAGAALITCTHLLGDAISPYIMAAMAEAFAARYGISRDRGLQVGLMISTCVLVLGAALYGATVFTYSADKATADRLSKPGEAGHEDLSRPVLANHTSCPDPVDIVS